MCVLVFIIASRVNCIQLLSRWASTPRTSRGREARARLSISPIRALHLGLQGVTTRSLEQDANKYKSAEAKKAATVDAENWQMLEEFQFTPLPAGQRFFNSLTAVLQLLFAAGLVLAFTYIAGRRV